jgi:putative SOS response-associated peptidase YedK
MCGRFTLAGADPASLRQRFPIGESVEIRPRFNVAPTDHVVSVTTDREGAPRGELLRWGLVPHWAPDPSVGARMINARAESVAEKPAFRDLLDRRRCLIVADGFYEWQPREGMRKQPWWVTRADHAPFAFAGLWTTWRSAPDVEPLRTCTIITTRASTSLTAIHPRMPVILPPEAEAAWLDHGTAREHVLDLLQPAPDDGTTARPVGFAVNSARHDEPDCLDPPPPDDAAPALF